MLNSLSPHIGRRAIRTNVGAFLRCWSVEDYSSDERREMWPLAKELSTKHIKNCRVVQNRVALLEHIPKRGKCAEIGVDRYCCVGNTYRHLHEAPIFTQSNDFVVDRIQTSIQEPLCLPTTEQACSQLVTIPAFVQVPKRALLDFARSVERIQQFAERNSDFRLL